ncbi:MAG: hypothetical protein Q4C09_09165 [Atopobiaceae bacterium]|nr:hypothetical protein [Atopobiaceae bacterium]
MTFLLSIVTNASLPKSFRTEIKDTITEYQKLSNGFLERIYTYAEKTGNRMATTDEERAELQEFLDELRAAGEDDQS